MSPSRKRPPKKSRPPKRRRITSSAVAQKPPIDRFEHDLRSLIRTNPRWAATRISAALKRNDAKIAPAAKDLRCSYRTLRRWIAMLREGGYKVEPLLPRKDRRPLRGVRTAESAENLSQ